MCLDSKMMSHCVCVVHVSSLFLPPLLPSFHLFTTHYTSPQSVCPSPHCQALFHSHPCFFCQCGSTSLFTERSMECGVKCRASMQLWYFLFCWPCSALTLPAPAPLSLASTIRPRGTVTLHPPHTLPALCPHISSYMHLLWTNIQA